MDSSRQKINIVFEDCNDEEAEFLRRFKHAYDSMNSTYSGGEKVIFRKLMDVIDNEEKSEIELTIFETKGINIEQHSRPRHSPADFGKSEEESCNIGR